MNHASEKAFSMESFKSEFEGLLHSKIAAQRVQGFSIHNTATSEEKAQARERELGIDKQMIEFVAQSMSGVGREERAAIAKEVESIWHSNIIGNIIGILSTFWRNVAIHAFDVQSSPEVESGNAAVEGVVEITRDQLSA